MIMAKYNGHMSAQDAIDRAHDEAWRAVREAPTPNYRAFCIAVLELQASAKPELIVALGKRYGLLLPDGTESPNL